MRRLALLLVLFVPAGNAFAQEASTEKVRLQYLRASELARDLVAGAVAESRTQGGEVRLRVLELPPGVEGLVPDDDRNTLTVRGSASAVADVKRLLRALDVPPRQITLNIRLLSYRFTEQGAAEEPRTLQSPIVSTLHRVPASLSVGDAKKGMKIDLLPRINGDGSITVLITMAEWGSVPDRQNRVTVLRRLEPGKPTRVLGVTDASGNKLREIVGRGELAVTPANHNALYVEVSASEFRYSAMRGGTTP